jgi:hypothetical protein
MSYCIYIIVQIRTKSEKSLKGSGMHLYIKYINCILDLDEFNKSMTPTKMWQVTNINSLRNYQLPGMNKHHQVTQQNWRYSIQERRGSTDLKFQKGCF